MSSPERLQQQLEEDDSTSIRSQQQLGLGWRIWAMVFIGPPFRSIRRPIYVLKHPERQPTGTRPYPSLGAILP